METAFKTKCVCSAYCNPFFCPLLFLSGAQCKLSNWGHQKKKKSGVISTLHSVPVQVQQSTSFSSTEIQPFYRSETTQLSHPATPMQAFWYLGPVSGMLVLFLTTWCVNSSGKWTSREYSSFIPSQQNWWHWTWSEMWVMPISNRFLLVYTQLTVERLFTVFATLRSAFYFSPF